MRIHLVTKLLVTAMQNAAKRYDDIPPRQRTYLDYRRYQNLLNAQDGQLDSLPIFISTLNYIRAHTGYPNDDPFLKIWDDELEKLLTTIQGEIIITELSSATPEDLNKFVKAHIRYLRHLK